jgi:Na+-translocating ferredoxin:NAD+ oxidoreductase RnfC subunit
MMDRISAIKKLREAGIVGAGGAGFPLWKKLDQDKVDYLIANGAECEPLLAKDRETMLQFSEDFVKGLQLLQALSGAEKVIIGLKQKNADIEDHLRPLLNGLKYEYVVLEDVYPAGDEYILVYEATGRRMQPGGFPLQVGCLVNNVETIVNASRAILDDYPVTEKIISINGAVKRPLTTRVPIGTSYADCLAMAGGSTVSEPVVFTGGIMMGGVESDFQQPVTRTTGGLIFLPADHYLVTRKQAAKESYTAHGHSACDQCSMCTELCPRYLLGYPIEPHKVMRTMQLTGSDRERSSIWAEFCCECNICSLFACPEALDPKSICVDNKRQMREHNIKWDEQALAANFLAPHPARKGREIPIKQLVLRLGLSEYDKKAPFVDEQWPVKRVEIPLHQHIGTACLPSVKVGQKVNKGQPIGSLGEGELGAPVHSSISGTVREVNAKWISIEE